MKNILFIIILVVVFGSCDKNHEPYEHSRYIPEFTAEINGEVFELNKITTMTPIPYVGSIGVFARDSVNLINIQFPIDCGKETFFLPNENNNVALVMNNIECKTGKLKITKYDVNLVEGKFEFEIEDQKNIVKIKKGNFSIVYRYEINK